jgi:hypothetical protein
LVEVVFERFKKRTYLNPCVQFKWVHQAITVEEYVREFQRAKTRLMAQTGIKGEYHYV